MKNMFFATCLALALSLTTTAAMADSIKGRLGVTGRVGFLVPADSEASGPARTIGTDVGFVGGGGFIYGIDKNIAAELDITHTGFDGDIGGVRQGSFDTTNISLGVQYRFSDPLPRLTPYAGGGLDILISDFTSVSGLKGNVDTVAGVHLSGGADYFVMKQLALTGEAKIVVAPNADITFGGVREGHFDPMNFSMTVGARYFFN